MRCCEKKHKEKNIQRQLEASYTVEAAILMPIVLAVMMALLQICFVWYDRVILREELEYVALRNTLEEELRVTFDSAEIENRFLISELSNLEVRETKNGVEIDASIISRRLVPLYFPGAEVEERMYSVNRKKTSAKEKTMISEVLLDALHVLE